MEKKNRFIITMVIIIICATMVNYSLYSILSIYFIKPSDVYYGVQMSMITTGITIVIVTIMMLALIPTEKVDEALLSIENGKSDEEQLRDIVGYDYEDNKK